MQAAPSKGPGTTPQNQSQHVSTEGLVTPEQQNKSMAFAGPEDGLALIVE